MDPLMHRAIPPVICSGLRGGEVALYLKYCGLKEEDITLVPLGKGLDLLLSPSYPGEESYIICNYTVLKKLRRLLLERGAVHGIIPGPSLPRTAGL